MFYVIHSTLWLESNIIVDSNITKSSRIVRKPVLCQIRKRAMGSWFRRIQKTKDGISFLQRTTEALFSLHSWNATLLLAYFIYSMLRYGFKVIATKLSRVVKEPFSWAICSWFGIQKAIEGTYFLHPSDKDTFQPAQLKCDLVARITVKKLSTGRLSYLLGYSLYCLPNEHHEESLI